MGCCWDHVIRQPVGGLMADYDAFYDQAARTQINAAAATLDANPSGTLRMAKNAKSLLGQMTNKPADYKALSAQIEDLAKKANVKIKPK